MTPNPNAPVQQQGWFSKNWKWLVPVGCLTPILCCGTFGLVTFMGVSKVIQGSGAYVTAVARASTNDEVQAALGSPLTPGFMMQGEISDKNGESMADFSVPLEGPRGKGTLYVKGRASRGGEWTYSRLEVELPGGKSVDLNALAGDAPPSKEPARDDAAPAPDSPTPEAEPEEASPEPKEE